MKVVSLIPIRGGSVGIPLKALALLNGRPLMDYVIETAFHTAAKDVWVATDHEGIKEHAIELGCKVLDEPEGMATDISSIEEVMMYFTNNVEYDIIVLLQITSPLTKSESIDNALYNLISSLKTHDSAMSVVDTAKNDILLWDAKEGKALNFNPLNRKTRKFREKRYYIETGQFYIITRGAFMKTKCRIGKKTMFQPVSYWTMPEIDSPEDLVMIEKLMK
jgi:N-acylneuraminate cytidylyltransferase